MKKKTANGVEYYQDYDRHEGAICLVSPKTIDRYCELQNEHPNTDDYGVFFAFGNDQFEQGRKRLITKGYIKDGDKVCSAGMGMYGTEAEIDRYLDFYRERSRKIAKECNPQEVYLYEWNNHECMFSSDDDAIRVIVDVFGAEVARTIKRVSPGSPIEILAPLTERDKHLVEHGHDLDMLARFEFDMGGFFSKGDCRYHRPDCLWGGNINRQIEVMREYYGKLPDDIKDASPMSKEQIDDYAERMLDWAGEYFADPRFDPIPHTPHRDLQDLEITLGMERLRYKDDDGKWQIPDKVWFSNDSRRWHKDETCTAGRAYTSYLGKHGTTLARVYITSSYGLNMVPYNLPHLCDVTARYDNNVLNPRLYGFYHE